MSGSYIITRAPATVWSLGITLFNMVCEYVPFAQDLDIITTKVNFTRKIATDFKDLLMDLFEGKAKLFTETLILKIYKC